MTHPTKRPRAVKAWVIVERNGRMNADRTFKDRTRAVAARWDDERIVRVTVMEVER